MGDTRETPSPDPYYNTPVKDVAYKDLLTSTFTLASHESGIKTWCVPTNYPECVYCGKRYRYERFTVECHVNPLEKQLAGKGLSHCAKNHYQHRAVLIENVSCQCRQKSAHVAIDKNSLLQEAAASAKPDFGSRLYTPLDLVAGLSCFCNGQTILSEVHGCGYQEGYLVSDGGFC
jgi:hypothetical protein